MTVSIIIRFDLNSVKGQIAPDRAIDALLEFTKLNHCPKCYSANVAYESGCSEPSCKDCGYSKCS